MRKEMMMCRLAVVFMRSTGVSLIDIAFIFFIVDMDVFPEYF